MGNINILKNPNILHSPGSKLRLGLLLGADLVLFGLTGCSEPALANITCGDPQEFIATNSKFTAVVDSRCANSYISQNIVTVWDLEDLGDLEGGVHGNALIRAVRDPQRNKITGCEVTAVIINGDVTEENFSEIVEKEVTGSLWACSSMAQNGWAIIDNGDNPADETGGIVQWIPMIDAGAIVYMYIQNPQELLAALGNPPQEVVDMLEAAAKDPWGTTDVQFELARLLAINGIIGSSPSEWVEQELLQPVKYYMGVEP